ncbi:ATP-binding protein [Vagococcus luciliae]|uniref:histidine kinase n=1 Tax=Vagococcus luciliae TaxID=2920380 RepID=A0ABY5NXX1_9ENTE|nr:sensor histidine kinase [Vagococcus luciliae]UUV98338.1 Sensor histidine kinase DcuS [Vagococcus luciliae]
MQQKISQFMSRFSLRAIIIFIVLLTTLSSLVLSSLYIEHYVVQNEYKHAKDKMSTIAKVFATDEQVKDALIQDKTSKDIQALSLEVATISNMDFIVVLDKELIRLSHPNPDVIGQPFSDLDDARKTLNGESHFSQKKGVLGDGIRFFVPVKDDNNHIIGVICAGITLNTLQGEINNLQAKITLILLIGLFVGIIGAIISSTAIKRILLGLEPQDISKLVQEKQWINDEINEGIIAINKDQEITLINQAAFNLLTSIDPSFRLIKNEVIDPRLYTIFFKECFTLQHKQTDQELLLHTTTLIATTSPITVNKVFNGAVITFRDQSEMSQLIHTLSGSQQYIDALRAQTHEFMNKTHVIMGLIEQKKYDLVQDYIQQISHDYQKEVGYVTDIIKSPAIAGFILGKINEAKEQNVNLTLDPSSFLPDLTIDDTVHHIIQILGNLLDNAIDATKEETIKNVNLLITYEMEGSILIIEVIDSGCGIQHTDVEQLFQKGFSTKGIGRGYGLHAIYRIVNEHGGLIDITNNDDIGATVYIELPLIE